VPTSSTPHGSPIQDGGVIPEKKSYRRIWLQVDPEGDKPDAWDDLEGATWCQDRINDNDIEYVLAERCRELEEALKEKDAFIETLVRDGAESNEDNARLREAIEKAPHGSLCEAENPYNRSRVPCNCWKRQALEPTKGSE